jgi:hypothetical protein
MNQESFGKGKSMKMTIKQHLSDDDVLLGRGTGSNEHVGNVRFRTIVMDVLQQSMCAVASKQRNSFPLEVIQYSKSSMAASVLAIVHKRGGHFVRKLSEAEARIYFKDQQQHQHQSKEEDSTTTTTVSVLLYMVVPREVAMEKAKQSFRHQKRVLNGGMKRPIFVKREPAAARKYVAKITTNFSASATDMIQAISQSSGIDSRSPTIMDGSRHHLAPSTAAAVITSALKVSSQPSTISSLSSPFHSALMTKHLLESRFGAASGNVISSMASMPAGYNPSFDPLILLKATLNGSFATLQEGFKLQQQQQQEATISSREALLAAASQSLSQLPLVPGYVNHSCVLPSALESDIKKQLLLLFLQQQQQALQRQRVPAIATTTIIDNNNNIMTNVLSELIALAAAGQHQQQQRW